MTQAIIAHMTLIERSQDGTLFAAIPEAKGVGVPSVAPEYVDVTHNTSPDGYREFIKGLKDAGELALSANYTAAGYEQQLEDQDFNGPITYRTTFPLAPGQTSGDVFTFQGYPTPTIDESDDPAAAIMMTITIRTTGGVSFAKGAAV